MTTDTPSAGERPRARAAAPDPAAQGSATVPRFYDCSYAMHRDLADMYTGDPRFTATYAKTRPGMSHDAPGSVEDAAGPKGP